MAAMTIAIELREKEAEGVGRGPYLAQERFGAEWEGQGVTPNDWRRR